jgi:hypothetical protein
MSLTLDLIMALVQVQRLALTLVPAQALTLNVTHKKTLKTLKPTWILMLPTWNPNLTPVLALPLYPQILPLLQALLLIQMLELTPFYVFHVMVSHSQN